jgi:hypothetical protein
VSFFSIGLNPRLEIVIAGEPLPAGTVVTTGFRFLSGFGLVSAASANQLNQDRNDHGGYAYGDDRPVQRRKVRLVSEASDWSSEATSFHCFC